MVNKSRFELQPSTPLQQLQAKAVEQKKAGKAKARAAGMQGREEERDIKLVYAFSVHTAASKLVS